MSTSLLIRGARLLDPSQGLDRMGDLLVVDGLIQRTAEALRDGDIPPGCPTLDGRGLVVCPGFIDLHCHLREPGSEDKETIATGVQAGARGGFTTLCCMPNTNPPMDTVSTVEFVRGRVREADLVRVLPIGCVTKERAGKELAELWDLAQAGVVGFSDDGSPVGDPHLMRQALLYTRDLGLPVIDHCEDPALNRGGVVHESWVAHRLGLRGWPAAAEEAMVARDIALADLTGGRLHLAHLSTAGSVELVRRAKERGLPVTAEAAPHHLALTDAWVLGHDAAGVRDAPVSLAAYDTATKVNPPLRSHADRQALIAGLREGVIDAIATDHAPHTLTDKLATYQEAAFGISGLETAVGVLLTLVDQGDLDMATVVAALTRGPAGVLGATCPTPAGLCPGSPADIVLLDPGEEWVVNSSLFASQGKNTPWEGAPLRGRVKATLVEGRVVHSELPSLAPGRPVAREA